MHYLDLQLKLQGVSWILCLSKYRVRKAVKNHIVPIEKTDQDLHAPVYKRLAEARQKKGGNSQRRTVGFT